MTLSDGAGLTVVLSAEQGITGLDKDSDDCCAVTVVSVKPAKDGRFISGTGIATASVMDGIFDPAEAVVVCGGACVAIALPSTKDTLCNLQVVDNVDVSG